QGIAPRGYDDLNNNFKQLLLLMSKNDDILRDWLTWKTTWTSVSIQAEIIVFIACTIQHDIAQKMFGLMADETADVSRIEQMVITFRSVDDDLEVYEDLGLHLLDCCNSETIYKTLKDILIRLNIPLSNCKAFCADGAATFQGAVMGVITRFQEDELRIAQAHCHMHSVNLAMSNAISNEPLTRNFLLLVQDIDFLCDSPKRCALVQKAETEKTASENKMKAQAGGYAKALENFEFYFCLNLSIHIFQISDRLSKVLQEKELMLTFKKSIVESEKVDVTPPKLPQMVQASNEPHRFESPQAFYRAKYFSIFDSTNGALQQRISDKATAVLLAVEDVLVAGWKGEMQENKKIDLICNFYGRNIDRDHLCHQLKSLENINDQNTMKRSISELVSILRDQLVLRKMLPVVVNLICLYLISPATTTIAEHSFSTLQQIKTYLRSTMSQPRLNSLITLNVYQETLDKLDMTALVNKFIKNGDEK
uniref:HAT C-terminal dimerisation domain-containing protein n=1 Tax=Latimeria chalumnae TaxID=7897 RepID=H3AEY2_LATCH